MRSYNTLLLFTKYNYALIHDLVYVLIVFSDLVNLCCLEPSEHDIAFQNFRMLQGFGAASAFFLGSFLCVSAKLIILIILLVIAILCYVVIEVKLKKMEEVAAEAAAEEARIAGDAAVECETPGVSVNGRGNGQNEGGTGANGSNGVKGGDRNELTACKNTSTASYIETGSSTVIPGSIATSSDCKMSNNIIAGASPPQQYPYDTKCILQFRK